MSKITQENQVKKLEVLPEVSKEFLIGNKEPCSKISKHRNKKGGPYSKKDRNLRMQKVSRLHFEYGYSANKISELLKVNRNTINNDIRNMYLTFRKYWNKISAVSLLQSHVESLLAQKRRLREELDITKKLSEKLAIEKMILQVESKIQQIQIRRGQYGDGKSVYE